MKTSLIFIAALLVPALGFAQDEAAPAQTQSEYMHQAEAGTFELRPSFGLANFHYEYKSNNTLSSANSYGFLLGLAAEYGFGESLSLGVMLNYQDLRTSYNTKPNVTVEDNYSRGLSDPDLYLLGRVKTESGWFRYGVSLNLPVEKSKTDGKTSNVAGSGTTVTPFVGYENVLGPGFIGGKLSYDVYRSDRDQEDTSSGTSVTTKYKDGQTLRLEGFYEWIITPFVDVGFSLGYNDYAETKTESNGTTTSNDNHSAQVSTSVYAPLHFKNQITLIPTVLYGTYTKYPSSTSVDSATYFLTGVTARFVF